MGSPMTHAQITITRGADEMLVNVSGTVIAGSKGFKNHPMDRFCEPDEEPEVDDVSAEGIEGGVIYLDDEEHCKACEAILEQAQIDRDSALVDAQIDEMRDEP